MHRATIAILLLAASLGPAASAQGQEGMRTALLAMDPGGDQAVVGPQVPNPAAPAPAYGNVDILAVLASQPVSSPTSVTLYVNFSAPPTLRQVVTFQFAVAKGPESAPGSTATGAVRTVTVAGTTVSGVEGATAGGSSSQLFLTLPYAGIGASPGDVLGQLIVTASDRDGGPTGGGPLPDSVPGDDSSASDRAPDSGAAAAFTLQPPPFRSDLAATIVGGEVLDANGTRPFTGASVSTQDG
ncbi:MAG TPA: hypothetical protein VHI93_04400, partial [Candidatus Thermoplasmatota archaeon]|nr:hypothetical protein [Candidatus Thermoplasmatota archaeon]